jgi:hypothetical protein
VLILTNPISFINPTTGKEKRRSCISKNEMLKDRLTCLTQCNHVKNKYLILGFSLIKWYNSSIRTFADIAFLYYLLLIFKTNPAIIMNIQVKRIHYEDSINPPYIHFLII